MAPAAYPMATPAPTPGAPEKTAVRSMFDRVAPHYDLLNRLLSAGTDVRWRRRCIDSLGKATSVLDVCTGTGDLLIEFLGRDAGRRGTGVDLSREMLVRGGAKLRARGLSARGHLAAGDAERLPVGGGRFDAAVVGFGIRNVADPAAALREIHRTLRPGGNAVVLEFGAPGGVLGLVYRFYFHRVLPFVGGLISGDRGAYAYLPASVARFPPPREFAALMSAAGFSAVEFEPLTGGIAYLYRGRKTV